ncbi:hypothetical protein, partial [Oceanobacillus picturae]|uniref:hypothetical protein n=1 Tax=Oceanobacillus picturae TaxID=171693 RepID=UPI001EE71F20
AEVIDRRAEVIDRKAEVIDRRTELIDWRTEVIDRTAKLVDRGSELIDKIAKLVDRNSASPDTKTLPPLLEFNHHDEQKPSSRNRLIACMEKLKEDEHDLLSEPRHRSRGAADTISTTASTTTAWD